MAVVRRVRDLARAGLPRSVGERLPAAPPREVTELLHDKRFQRSVAAAAEEQGRDEEEVWAEVKGYLHEMAAAHDDRKLPRHMWVVTVRPADRPARAALISAMFRRCWRSPSSPCERTSSRCFGSLR